MRKLILVDEYRASILRQRPYRVENTGSLPNSAVKQRRARLVLGWGTAWESLGVLLAFCSRSVIAQSGPSFSISVISQKNTQNVDKFRRSRKFW